MSTTAPHHVTLDICRKCHRFIDQKNADENNCNTADITYLCKYIVDKQFWYPVEIGGKWKPNATHGGAGRSWVNAIPETCSYILEQVMVNDKRCES